MQRTLRRTLPALALLATIGCQAPPPALSTADIEAARAFSQAFQQHVLAQEWDAATAMYTDSAVFMPPNSPALKGHAAIREWMGAFPPVASFTVTTDAVVGAGDLMYTYGRYDMTLGLPGSPTDNGKFVDIRRRQKDGSWKFEVDIFNTSVPLPPPAPMPMTK